MRMLMRVELNWYWGGAASRVCVECVMCDINGNGALVGYGPVYGLWVCAVCIHIVLYFIMGAILI